MNKTAKINNLMVRLARLQKIAKIPAIDVVLWSENTDMRHRDLQEHHRQKVKITSLPRVLASIVGNMGNRIHEEDDWSDSGFEVEGWEENPVWTNSNDISLVISNPDFHRTGEALSISIRNSDYYKMYGKHLPQPIIEEIEQVFGITGRDKLTWRQDR